MSTIPEITNLVAIPFYLESDYHRILEIMEDAETFPKSYLDWLQGFEENKRRLIRDGKVVIPAKLDPNDFPIWARSLGLAVKADARDFFAREFACRYIADREGR